MGGIGLLGTIFLLFVFAVLLVLLSWAYFNFLDAKAMRKKLEEIENSLDAVQQGLESQTKTSPKPTPTENE